MYRSSTFGTIEAPKNPQEAHGGPEKPIKTPRNLQIPSDVPEGRQGTPRDLKRYPEVVRREVTRVMMHSFACV